MAFLDTQGLQYVRQACDKRYLLLSGGTMTGTLHSRETGCSWIDSRNTDNSAIHFRSIPDADGNVYCPYLGGKTASGHTWTIGGYQDKVGINVIRSDRTVNGTDADSYFNTITGQTYSSGGFKGNLEGNASSANKLNTDAGSSTQPVYFSGGRPVACTSYASATVAWNNVSGKPDFATVATSGSYNDLKNKPTIPAAANNGTIIINQAGSEKGRFTVNQSGSTTINLTDNNTVPARYVTKYGIMYEGTAGAVGWQLWNDNMFQCWGTCYCYENANVTGQTTEKQYWNQSSLDMQIKVVKNLPAVLHNINVQATYQGGYDFYRPVYVEYDWEAQTDDVWDMTFFAYPNKDSSGLKISFFITARFTRWRDDYKP